MRVRLPTCLVGFCLGSALFFSGVGVHAQTRIALKSGESTELPDVLWAVNCRSIIVGNPEIEILEGPAELTVALKPKMVLPRRANCAKLVPGWSVTGTAKDVNEPMQGTLTYRIKVNTKDGDRQESHVYNLSLFP